MRFVECERGGFGGVLIFSIFVALQAEYVRQQFISATKTEFVKYLPQIAEEQSQYIYEAVKKSQEAILCCRKASPRIILYNTWTFLLQ